MPENQAELFEEQVKLFGQHKWWKGDLNCSLPIATHLILNYIFQHWRIYIYLRQIIKPYLNDQNDLSMHTLPTIHFCLYFLLLQYTLFCTQLVRLDGLSLILGLAFTWYVIAYLFWFGRWVAIVVVYQSPITLYRMILNTSLLILFLLAIIKKNRNRYVLSK